MQKMKSDLDQDHWEKTVDKLGVQWKIDRGHKNQMTAQLLSNKISLLSFHLVLSTLTICLLETYMKKTCQHADLPLLMHQKTDSRKKERFKFLFLVKLEQLISICRVRKNLDHLLEKATLTASIVKTALK